MCHIVPQKNTTNESYITHIWNEQKCTYNATITMHKHKVKFANENLLHLQNVTYTAKHDCDA